MSMRPVVVWFRQDLRLADNVALTEAVKTGHPVIMLYIFDEQQRTDQWRRGAASRWFLHHCLEAFDKACHKAGNRLVILKGDARDVLVRLTRESDAQAVYFNRQYEPFAIERDRVVVAALRQQGVDCHDYNSSLLFEPGTIATAQNEPYKVFTPYYRTCLTVPPPDAPLPAPKKLPHFTDAIESVALEELALLPTIPWDAGFKDYWSPGEIGAKAVLNKFLDGALATYKIGRDRPDFDGVSTISPYLHFGCIGPRQIWHAVKHAAAASDEKSMAESADTYLKEVIWREFAHHLMFHFPHSVDKPLRSEFSHFPQKADAALLQAWQKGNTGYPIVDAGMRQLWHTGWMHNRVRMIVASFLVKDLLAPWIEGAKWFWDTLVDADLANNTLGWQWSAGCGSDAAPYFRIFNPVLQGKKFDPNGEYVRKWVPELKNVPDQYIHSPFTAPPLVLRGFGVTLGEDYPLPVVDHSVARSKALEAFSVVKNVKAASRP